MQPDVDHRRGVIQPPASAADDPFDELAQLLVRFEVHPDRLLLASVADGEHPQWSVDDDLLYARVVHQRLKDAESKDRVEEAPLHRLGVHQQWAVGGDGASLVGGDLLVDDDANAVNLLRAWRRQLAIAQRAADGIGHALADQALGGTIACVRRDEVWLDGYHARPRGVCCTGRRNRAFAESACGLPATTGARRSTWRHQPSPLF